MEILTHPVTLLMLATLSATLGWILKSILDLNKTQAMTTEILKHVVDLAEKNASNHAALRSDFDRLRGQHEALTLEHQKKTQ